MLWDTDMWREMDRLRRDMDGLFSDYGRASGATTYPLLNVYEDSEKIAVTAELAGMTKDQVNITYSDGVLTIAGRRVPLALAKGMDVVRRERATGDFEKTVRIPVKVQQDKLSASFANGVLTVELPKAEEAKPRTIAIQAR
jgi:HSP20 family protein